jgi:hypothetical protein
MTTETTLYQISLKQTGTWLALIWAESGDQAKAKLIAERGYGYYTPESLETLAAREMDNATRIANGLALV